MLTEFPARPALAWENGFIVAVDQRSLPAELRLVRLGTVDQVVEAIRTLAIRGAPTIGLAGALGVALSAHLNTTGSVLNEGKVRDDAARLTGARPTAVNLAWGVRRALGCLPAGAKAVLDEAQAMVNEDAAANRAAARRAADLVLELVPGRRIRVLTHCNTGHLATAGEGTALGAILELARRGHIEEVLVDETRPLLQGARLTAWELGEAAVPYRLCADSAAAAAMAGGLVDCVLVGADRIATNGDTANKIGTYGLAVAAARHAIPLIVVAPETTWDDDLPDGSGIPIEERSPDEITQFRGMAVAPAGAAAFNPAFDVTPGNLITALVSERRTMRPAPALSPTARRDSGAKIASLLTEYPDFPTPGVVFRDLAGVYAEAGLLARLAEDVIRQVPGRVDRVLAVESRGFVLGGALAAYAGVPLILARKPGKLPGPVLAAGYTLEYGDDQLEIQKGALPPGQRILCVDDVLATGGTLRAVAGLVEASGAEVAGMAVLVALTGLAGRARLSDHPLVVLCEVPS